MGRKSNPYIRVTSVGSFVNAGWKEYWYKGLENGNEKKGIVGLRELAAQACVEFGTIPHSADEWERLLARYSPLREAERIGDESKAFGTKVHKVAESHLFGTPLPTGMQPDAPTERELTQGNLIVKWIKEAQVKPLIIEGKLAVEFELKDDELGLIGHPDLFNTFGDDPTVWVTDWKTSKECRLEYIIQLSLYAEMAWKQYGINADHGAIIRAPSDPTVMPQFEAHEFHGLRGKYLELALEALDVFKFFSRKGRWAESK